MEKEVGWKTLPNQLTGKQRTEKVGGMLGQDSLKQVDGDKDLWLSPVSLKQ